jgi:hypothetical protein
LFVISHLFVLCSDNAQTRRLVTLQNKNADLATVLVLLAITFSPKRVLAPATEKGDGETGVLLAAADGKCKVFTKSVKITGRVLWQEGLPSQNDGNWSIFKVASLWKDMDLRGCCQQLT